MLPRVVLHNAVSLDGKIEGFMPDMGTFYELAGRFGCDIQLAGSNTILKQEHMLAEDGDGPFEAHCVDPSDERGLLVVPDSWGRIRRWLGLRQSGFWRDVLALCSETTPQDYLKFLEERHVQYIVAGKEKVDMRAALELLAERFKATRIHLDGGGILNGVMLREGLVDEVSVLVHPCLMGSAVHRSVFHLPEEAALESPLELELRHVEQLESGGVWLRYLVKG